MNYAQQKYSPPTTPITTYLKSLELIHLTSVRAGIIRNSLVSLMNLFVMKVRQNTISAIFYLFLSDKSKLFNYLLISLYNRFK